MKIETSGLEDIGMSWYVMEESASILFLSVTMIAKDATLSTKLHQKTHWLCLPPAVYYKERVNVNNSSFWHLHEIVTHPYYIIFAENKGEQG